jgi:hypothetical protein
VALWAVFALLRVVLGQLFWAAFRSRRHNLDALVGRRLRQNRPGADLLVLVLIFFGCFAAQVE